MPVSLLLASGQHSPGVCNGDACVPTALRLPGRRQVGKRFILAAPSQAQGNMRPLTEQACHSLGWPSDRFFGLIKYLVHPANLIRKS